MCRLSLNLGASASWNPLGLWRPSPGLFCLIYSIKERWVWRTWKQIWGRTVRTGAGELSVTYLLTYTKEQSPSWECNRFCSWSRNSPHFMESEGSLPHSQVSAICPYPGPVRSTTRGDAFRHHEEFKIFTGRAIKVEFHFPSMFGPSLEPNQHPIPRVAIAFPLRKSGRRLTLTFHLLKCHCYEWLGL